ncbi:hypothetical protein MOP88_04170 [Sphingomonas sp. WKB10]|nr:hypothetical protein [Sphingomonas sp. WKB10]
MAITPPPSQRPAAHGARPAGDLVDHRLGDTTQIAHEGIASIGVGSEAIERLVEVPDGQRAAGDVKDIALGKLVGRNRVVHLDHTLGPAERFDPLPDGGRGRPQEILHDLRTKSFACEILHQQHLREF